MQTISAVTFERAARRIQMVVTCHHSPGESFACYACYALEESGSNKAEDLLFRKMHKPKKIRINESWFGTKYIGENQRIRKQLLAEVALNLRAQGFVIGGKNAKKKVSLVPNRSKARKK